MPLTAAPKRSKAWLCIKIVLFLLLAIGLRVSAAPPIIVKGHVLDEEGKGVPGIVVQVKGTDHKYVTDADGQFVIHDLDPKAILVFSGINIETLEIGANGRTELSVQVKYKVQAIADVVVTGYQRIDRKKFTGAAVTLNADSIKLDGVTDVSRMLEGRAAGVSIQNVSGTFGTAPKVRIRGATSITGENKPLWVIDGVVLEDVVNVSNEQLSSGNASTLLGSSVAGLNASDIETFDILKDASATALYGARAMNGVISITTKKGKSGKPTISYTGNYGVQLKPSYRNFDMMNSGDQMSVYAELERKEILDFPQEVNARNSGVFGKIAQEAQTPDANGNFLVQNTTPGRQAALMQYANDNTNWFGILFRNSLTQDHSLSVSSGSDKSQSYFSTSFFDDPGWTIADGVKRYTANINQNYNMSSKLTLGFQMTGSVRQQKTAGTEDRSSDPVVGLFSRNFDLNPFSYSLNTSRVLPAYDKSGNLEFFTRDFTPFNIINETQNNTTKVNVEDIKLQTDLNYKITPQISYNFKGGLRYVKTSEEHDVNENSNEANAYRANQNGIVNQSNPFLYKDPDFPNNPAIVVLPYGGFYNRIERQFTNYTFRNVISYNQSFGGTEHQVSFLAGQELRYINRQTSNNMGVGYQYNTGGTPFVDYFFFKRMSEQNQTYYGMTTEFERYAAFFSSGSYTYENKYTFSAFARVDGSNTMGSSPKARWLPTWTVAGVWNVDREKFLENANSISHLAFKASYGLNASTGNAVNTTSILRASQTPRTYLADQQTAINITDLENADLTWEKKFEANAGIDMGLFSERLAFTLDLYNRNSFDLIGLVRTAGIGGQTFQNANYATLKSHGIDFSITGKIINTPHFSFTSNFIFSFNTTRITNDKYAPAIWNLVSEGGGAKEGFPVRGLFSIKNAGLDPTYGTPLFINDSGVVSPVMNLLSLTSKYLKYEGPTDPIFTGGWTNTFHYRDLSLSILLTYQAGSKIRLTPVYSTNYSDLSALPNEFKRRWTLPGDDKLTNIPSVLMLSSTKAFDLTNQNAFPYNNYNYSSDRVADGGFVRLKAITLNYQLPQTMATHIGFRNAGLSVTGNNLWLIYSDNRLHGQDPEFFNTGGVALPVNKQITMSLKLGL
jgi:TonB-linked SusC/RagA family outer membrane protein